MSPSPVDRFDAAIVLGALVRPDGSPSPALARRVALARLGLWGARLWLLDEPAANLDAAGQAVVVSALERHLATGGCALISTHQPLDLPESVNRLWRDPKEAA